MDLEALRQFYARIEQLFAMHDRNAKFTGELFNVFKVLKLQASEVRLHTALIAELINPKGTHRQGTTFLETFLQEVGVSDLDAETCEVTAEKSIGSVKEDYAEGGRIDISIKDAASGREVIIENKIYAGDQKNQLLRYSKYNPKAALFYLTLDGREPSDESLGDLETEKVQLISYQDHILPWLETCRKEAATLPTVRETISQYMAVIRSLTHRGESQSMNQEIRKLILEERTRLLPSIEACAYELNAMRLEAKTEFEKLLNKSFPDRLVTQFKGAQIVCEKGEDGGGVYYGYRLLRDGELVVDMPEERARLAEELKHIRGDFETNNINWLGWRNPPEFPRGERFSSMPIERIVDMFSNSQILEGLVKTYLNEEREIRTDFLERIRKLENTQ